LGEKPLAQTNSRADRSGHQQGRRRGNFLDPFVPAMTNFAPAEGHAGSILPKIMQRCNFSLLCGH